MASIDGYCHIFCLIIPPHISKESSVDKLYVSIFAICNSETQFHSLLPRYFPDLSKKYFSTSSPNLFARRQAFAAIRRRTQWIKRKINGRENEKRRCCASNQGIYAANSLSHLIKKVEGAMGNLGEYPLAYGENKYI